jgi:hypothetical protein
MRPPQSGLVQVGFWQVSCGSYYLQSMSIRKGLLFPDVHGSRRLVASKTVISAPQLQSPLNNPRFRSCGHYDKAVVWLKGLNSKAWRSAHKSQRPQRNSSVCVCWIRAIYSPSSGATMIRASISVRTCAISSNFRSKAANILFNKAR